MDNSLQIKNIHSSLLFCKVEAQSFGLQAKLQWSFDEEGAMQKQHKHYY